MAAALVCAADGMNTMWSVLTMPAGLGMTMLGALMERKAQRGTNRACSGMIATVALPHTVQGLRRWSEHLGGDGMVMLKDASPR